MTLRRRDQVGSMAPLMIGFAFVVAMLVAVVVDASAVYLRREGLNALADAAALAATEGLQGERVYERGLGEHVELDAVAARRYVSEFLSADGALARFPDLRWTVATTTDTVQVRLRTTVELPLRVPGAPTTTRVTGSAAAVVQVTS